MRQANQVCVTNGAMVADVTSTAILMEQELFITIQAVWTGTPVGDFTLQISNDVGTDQFGAGVTHWTTYTGSTQAAGGASGDFVWNVDNYPAKWIRLKYTHSSSTGTLNARFNVKGY